MSLSETPGPTAHHPSLGRRAAGRDMGRLEVKAGPTHVDELLQGHKTAVLMKA